MLTHFILQICSLITEYIVLLMMQRFEGLTGDESDDGDEEADEAENKSENAQFCDDG